MKRKLFIVLLGLTFLVVLPVLSFAQFGSISGRVIDDSTGLPIMGAHVWAKADTTQPGGYGFDITDTLGFYMIDSLYAGEFLVFANAQGYYEESYPESVIVIAGENTPDIDFALTPTGDPQFGSVSGMVTDEVTGFPIEGAAITLSGIYCVWYTDSTGYYLCEQIPAGSYLVHCYASGYHFEVYPESVIVLEGQNTPNIDFALTPLCESGSISGRVTQKDTGDPILGAHVTAIPLDTGYYGEAWTDSNGYYIIEGLCVGIWEVHASKPGYYPEIFPDSVNVVEGQTTPDIDFTLTPMVGTSSISGRVCDQVTGLPLIGAHLVATGLDTYCFGEAWSDSNGYYIIEDLCAGLWLVEASKTGYYPQVYPDSVIVVEEQTTPDIDFALTPMVENGSISGRVGDEQAGIPLIEAHLVAIGLDNYCFGEAWSDTGGNYTILNLGPGAYQVKACYMGYVPETYPESVIVESGQNTSPVNFDLIPNEEPGSISGNITDQISGDPIHGVHVIGVESDTWCIAHAWTDSNGNYILQDLWPGIWLVRGEKQGYIPGVFPDSVAVVEGQNCPDIDFTLAPIGGTGSISGVVTDDATGIPLPMAHVLAYDSTFVAGEAWTDTAGLYLMQNIAAGQYIVRVTKEGYEDGVYPESVIVVANQNTPDIDFALIPTGNPESGSISGRVTDEETGLPIEMAEITITGIYCIWLTDSCGYYFCDNLPPDAYQVNAAKQGYVSETYPESVIVVAGENTPDIDFALTPFIFGDVDRDGEVHLVDVVYLINYLFKNGPVPDPLEAADVNCDGEVSVSDVVYLINYLFKCGPKPGFPPGGALIDFFGCKTFQKGDTVDDSVSPDQDCMEYEYDGESVLLLKHINAGFNCCPDEIIADITIEDNVITIEEDESLESGGCDCLCLFDLDLEVTNLPPGEYTIKVIELYVSPDDEPLEFTVDLSSSTSGIYCVERTHYPWGDW